MFAKVAAYTQQSGSAVAAAANSRSTGPRAKQPSLEMLEKASNKESLLSQDPKIKAQVAKMNTHELGTGSVIFSKLDPRVQQRKASAAAQAEKRRVKKKQAGKQPTTHRT